MRSTFASILLLLIALARAKELVASRIANVQDFTDKLVDKFFDRVIQVCPIHYAELEHTTLAKDPSHLAVPRGQSAALGPKMVPSLTKTAAGARRPMRPAVHCAAHSDPIHGLHGLLSGKAATYRARHHAQQLVASPGLMLPLSERKHARLGVARAVSTSDTLTDTTDSAELKKSTLTALDALLGEEQEASKATSDNSRKSTLTALDDLLGEEEAPKATSVNSSLTEKRVGRRDQRNEFRKLLERTKRQLYISTQLSLKTQRKKEPSLQPGVMPDLEWLATSDLEQPPVSGSRASITERLNHRETQQTLPVVTMGYSIAPGELLRLNLYEPRWITLFAKLTADNSSSRVLRSASGWQDVDLDAGGAVSDAVKLYDLEEREMDQPSKRNTSVTVREDLERALSAYPLYSGPFLVPGGGRLNESFLEGTRRFAVCLKPYQFKSPLTKEKIATVGTVVEIIGTDVKTVSNGMPTLIVIARGVERFRATRIRQSEPYTMVDTVPLVDMAEDGHEDEERATRETIMGLLAKNSSDFAPVVVVDQMTEDMFAMTPQEDVVAGIKEETGNLNTQALAVMLLRSKANAAQALLASTSAKQRRALVDQWLAMSDEGPSIPSRLFALFLSSLPLIVLFSALSFFLDMLPRF